MIRLAYMRTAVSGVHLSLREENVQLACYHKKDARYTRHPDFNAQGAYMNSRRAVSECYELIQDAVCS